MSNTDYKPRFSFEITYDQKLRADRLLENYGMRKALFTKILDDVLDLVEDHGGVAIGIIMSGSLKPREILPSLKQAELAAEKLKE